MKTKYPTNYDFGSNWKTKIVPFLSNKKIKQAVRKGINLYLSDFKNCKKKYKNNTVPANYSSKDYYLMITDRQSEIIIEELIKNNKLPQRYLELENAEPTEDFDENDINSEWFKMRADILDPYFTYDKVKDDLETYYVSGACHTWNPTFGLELAKLVEPNEKWRVQTGEDHTTIINENDTKVFDLLYWCDNNRLENYLFGDKVTKKDKTMGGKAAYLDSLY